MRLTKKVAIITGAGSGIGASIAGLFAREGARIVVADVSTNGEKTVDAIKDAGGQAVFAPVDVTRETEIQALMKSTIDNFGKLDILVNCAGIFSKEIPVDKADKLEWERVFAVNVEGMFLTCKYAIPLLKSTSGGAIINIASSAGVRPAPRHAAYFSSKGAVITLSKALAIELAPDKIRVNYINPGLTDTPLLEQFSEEAKKSIIQGIPLGGIIKPEDIAYAALYLASDESRMVTGAGIDVDGGQGI